MLNSSKYDLVHELFQKVAKSSKSPNALTYKGSFLVSPSGFFLVASMLHDVLTLRFCVSSCQNVLEGR